MTARDPTRELAEELASLASNRPDRLADRFAERLRIHFGCQDQALTAALVEAAGLRGALEEEYLIRGDSGDDEACWYECEQCEQVGGIDLPPIKHGPECPLAPSPLSQAAAEVLEAAVESWLCFDTDEGNAYHPEDPESFDRATAIAERYDQAVRRYLALRGEGEEGCPCGLPGGRHKLQCPANPDRQSVVTAKEKE